MHFASGLKGSLNDHENNQFLSQSITACLARNSDSFISLISEKLLELEFPRPAYHEQFL